MRPRLVTPGHKRLPDKIDKTNVGLSMQTLNLLQKGLRENLWPSWVRDYEPQGLQNDLAVVYHQFTFAAARGFVLGLKGAEAAIRKAKLDAEGQLQAATDARERDLEYAGPSMDDAVQRIRGIEAALERLHELLEKQKVPEV